MNAVRSTTTIERHAPQARGPTVLFSIAFKSPMADADLAHLRGALDLVTYSSRKPGVRAAQPGVVPLDFWSGLFLESGEGQDEWLLEARTWSNPPDPLVHEWRVRAAIAAKGLDPDVSIPPRADTVDPRGDTLPLGRAETKHLAHQRHRLLHLGR